MRLSTQIIIAFSIIIVLSIADSYTNYLLSQKVERNMKFLSKSETVIRNSNHIHKTIIEMQSAFRGFLLTEDAAFLDSYYTGIEKVPNMLASQKILVNSNAHQIAILDTITVLHSQWVHYSQSLIKSKKNVLQSPSDHDTYNYLFEGKLKKQVGKKLNDAITLKFRNFDKSEYKERNVHSTVLNDSIATTHKRSFMFLGLTIIVGLLSAIYIFRLISKRIATMVLLAEEISKGKFTVVEDSRNDELTGLSRSLNIMSDKLSKSIKELENRNIELNKFAYVVSHDLKAPIRGIHNVIKWIEEDLGSELSPQMRKYLRIIPQRTQRMEALINGLLDYARISKKTAPEHINLNVLIHEIADSIVPRNFKLEIADLPTVSAEKLKLEQVFANLISNAVKYTQREDGHISITHKEFPGYYEFSVADNGIGILAEYHSKIFEIFQTLREKNEMESTGVGLAIVKKIIEEQNGWIKVESGLGEGTKFTFSWKKQ